jgi:hypothetical protein
LPVAKLGAFRSHQQPAASIPVVQQRSNSAAIRKPLQCKKNCDYGAGDDTANDPNQLNQWTARCRSHCEDRNTAKKSPNRNEHQRVSDTNQDCDSADEPGD